MSEAPFQRGQPHSPEYPLRPASVVPATLGFVGSLGEDPPYFRVEKGPEAVALSLRAPGQRMGSITSAPHIPRLPSSPHLPCLAASPRPPPSALPGPACDCPLLLDAFELGADDPPDEALDEPPPEDDPDAVSFRLALGEPEPSERPDLLADWRVWSAAYCLSGWLKA